MRWREHIRAVAVVCLLSGTAAAAPACPPDGVQVGALCVDRFEASVWAIAADDTGLLERLRSGAMSAADLQAADAIQIGCGGRLYGLTARSAVRGRVLVAQSVAGVLPATCITWDDAARACAAASKRLLTVQEWQAAADGTPRGAKDDEVSDCNLHGPPFGVAPTGTRARCVSAAGVHDMPGNVEEWVEFPTVAPATPLRIGRAWYAGAVDLHMVASRPLSPATGFRCARPL